LLDAIEDAMDPFARSRDQRPGRQRRDGQRARGTCHEAGVGSMHHGAAGLGLRGPSYLVHVEPTCENDRHVGHVGGICARGDAIDVSRGQEAGVCAEGHQGFSKRGERRADRRARVHGARIEVRDDDGGTWQEREGIGVDRRAELAARSCPLAATSAQQRDNEEKQEWSSGHAIRAA
jgi:hypothetical protein